MGDDLLLFRKTVNKTNPKYKFLTLVIIQLLFIASCTHYKIIRKKGCLVGLHDQTMTYKLGLLKDSTESSSYLRLKKIILENGFEREYISNNENDCALFREKDSPYKMTLLINRWTKKSFTLIFEEGSIDNEPSKRQFKNYCNKRLEGLKIKYLSR